MHMKTKTIARVLLGLFALQGICHAEVKLPSFFSDHMVLQQGTTLPVWGWADPAKGQHPPRFYKRRPPPSTRMGSGWSKFASLSPSPSPLQMIITGRNTVTINDILVGECWIGLVSPTCRCPLREVGLTWV